MCDLHLLVSVFDAFVTPGDPGAAILSTVGRDWRCANWPFPGTRLGALFEYDGIDWFGHVEASAHSYRGRRYENVTIRLPTDGCLLRSTADAVARGGGIVEGPGRLHHHNRAFYHMTVLVPICDPMLQLMGRSARWRGRRGSGSALLRLGGPARLLVCRPP